MAERESERPPWRVPEDAKRQWFRMAKPTAAGTLKRGSLAADEVATNLTGVANHLFNVDRLRTDRLERYFKLYGGTRLIGIRPWEDPLVATANVTANRAILDALRLNVCKAAVDTITSKVGKLRPRPTFVTDHGNWSLQLRAKKLQQFMDGAYHQADVYEVAPLVFRDAMIFGTGVIHPYVECQKMRSERVPPYELFVDPADAVYGMPRCIYHIKWVSRDQARATWPQVVNMAPPGGQEASSGGNGVEAWREGYVRVIEAWARAIPGVESGAHALVVGGEVVSYEEYESEDFPFVFVHWSKPVQGFWGDSAIQEVVGLQVEINKLIQHVQRSMALVGSPWLLRKDKAIIKPGKLTNLPGQEIIVEGSVPLDEAVRVVTFQPVHPQVVAHIWGLYAKAFEILGSNQLAASATAPPGLESGRALEQLAEEHSERFMTVSRHFEWALGKSLSQQFIRLAKELDEEIKEGGDSRGFVLRSPGGGRGSQSITLRWDEVSIDEDGYIAHVWPESVLPSTPAARTEHVQKLADAGWISREEARRLLDFPDLAAEDDLATADEDNLHRQLSDMLERGESVMPEPFQNLDRALVVAQQAVLRASADRVPEERIDLVREFLYAVEALLQRAAAAAQPTPQLPASPGAAPTAPAPAGQPAPAM